MGVWSKLFLLSALMAPVSACEINLGSDADESEDEGKKKKKKKKKSGDADETEGDFADAEKSLLAFEGEDPLGEFGGAFGLAGDEHSPDEPNHFDYRWIAVEVSLSQKLMRGAKPKTTRMSQGDLCMAFQSNGVVRRMLMGSGRPGAPVEELWMSPRGDLIFWNKNHAYGVRKPPMLEWAYFHRGVSLELYQMKRAVEARRNAQPPAGLRNFITSRVGECLQKVGARNPRPSAEPAAPAPAPARGSESGGGGQHGAIAFSKSTGAWYMSAHHPSESMAKNVATTRCGRSDCAVYETYGPGQCRAVISRPDRGVSWGRGTHKNAAINAIQSECTKHKIANCTPHAWACNAGVAASQPTEANTPQPDNRADEPW